MWGVGQSGSKLLFLLRHGKSDWDAGHEGDHERPLARRGRRAARLVGQWLSERGQIPDFAISSTAVRARDTLRLAAEAGGWPTPIEETRALYLASTLDTLELIRTVAGDPNTLLLAGHQPTMSSLVSHLIGGGAVRFPTAAVCCLRTSIASWESAQPGAFELDWHVTPKLLAFNAAS